MVRPKPIVGVGRIAFDIVGVVPRFPDADTRVELSELSIQGSGSVATALATIAALGGPAACIGYVGPDRFGQLALDLLAGDGVDVSRVRVGKGQLSPFTFVTVGADTGSRATFTTQGDVEPPDVDSFGPDLAVVEEAALLLLDGDEPALENRAAARARAAKVPVLLDLGRYSDSAHSMIGQADILICSERFALEAAPRGELEDALKTLASQGPRSVVITLGAAGSIALDGGRILKQPALGPPAASATGVGSVFHGALGYGLARGFPFERVLELASAVAGLSASNRSARAGLPSAAAAAQLVPWLTSA